MKIRNYTDESFIAAINIICLDKLMNSDRYPLLIYCNGKNSLLDELKNSSQFRDILYKFGIFDDLSKYLSAYIAYAEYGNSLVQGTIKIYDIFDIENSYIFEKINNAIIKKICDECDVHSANINNINILYSILNEKYGITENTLINYIRYMLSSELTDDKDQIYKMIGKINEEIKKLK